MPRKLKDTVIQMSPRVAANKVNGSKGGRSTLARHTAEWISDRAARGGNKLKELYGPDYFKYIRTFGKARPVKKYKRESIPGAE